MKFINWAPLFLGALLIPVLNTKYLFDHFTVIKWFAVYVLAMIAIVTIFTYKKISVPKFPNWVSLFLGGAALIFVWHMLQGHTRFIHSPTADRLSIVALCFYFFLVWGMRWSIWQWIKPGNLLNHWRDYLQKRLLFGATVYRKKFRWSNCRLVIL